MGQVNVNLRIFGPVDWEVDKKTMLVKCVYLNREMDTVKVRFR
jgi:hypothetical protein